jgi:hypothetical protein
VRGLWRLAALPPLLTACAAAPAAEPAVALLITGEEQWLAGRVLRSGAPLRWTQTPPAR